MLKASTLENSKSKLYEKYQKAADELGQVKYDDGVSVANKVLMRISTPRINLDHSVKASDCLCIDNNESRYLSFSESDEEIKIAKDSKTN
jgi:hypothetical protein